MEQSPGPRPVRAPGSSPMVCAVCGRVLDFHEGRGWAHTITDLAGEDHPAVPVWPGEVPVRGRCDFCATDYPTWVVPTRSFVVQGNRASEGDWSACTTCKDLLERNEWSRLTRRSVACWERENGVVMPEPVRAGITRMHRLVRKHVCGAIRPLDAPGWDAPG